MSVSPLLLIRAIRARRSSAGVSIGYLAVLEVGFALWFAYALALANVALLVPNGVAFVVNGVAMAVAFVHRPDAVPH
jgi:uncharacterized protein with PQ loop repeat